MFKKLKSMFGGGAAEEEQKPQQEAAQQEQEVEPAPPAEQPTVADVPAETSATAVEVTSDAIDDAQSVDAQVDTADVVEPAEKEELQVETDHIDAPATENEAIIETPVVDEPVAEIAEEPVAVVEEAAEPAVETVEAEETEEIVQETPEPPVEEKKGFFARIKSGLSKTKANLTEQLGNLFLGAKEIDEDLLEEIETLLLMADVGVEATTEIIGRLTDKVERKQLGDAQALQVALKEELAGLLHRSEEPLNIQCEKKPYVILMVGVNGVGKTTTIGKLAKRFQSEGKSVMLAAGDTFRAAAVEQLQVWGERNNVPVVAQHTGADSASVIYDAVQSAQAKGVDVLIADTAGRLQNKDNLMQELEKVVRVTKKLSPEAPHEVMLVLDAGTGQNALSQAKIFKDSVGVTGISLTKLDGTAKGGVIFAIAKQMDLPIRFIGVGEQIDDLRPFKSQEFVDALFD
ncbi:signal recognition particle-docking protein FtsY [Neptuniibacter caesariensis]|uniref:Signal recognition particle receptor FtsY n=1 Tax=Neptuniibacter caesariensis TaxID=207954 RepID=A0A7U8C7L0_NEPCE|nr:signal recognition particle-docking protein FtsY [Neptuniibacter caesariensis]EAR62759.1 signal recognition particle receptor FtsY [Oceanospirillum sp. MED92] [Neptuniibacter caesariensis]